MNMPTDRSKSEMNIEKMRSEFEVWSANHEFLGCCVVDRISSGKYRDYDLQCAWESWQQSRAAIEVELPVVYPDSPDPLYEVAYAQKCRETLESIGLKVKQP